MKRSLLFILISIFSTVSLAQNEYLVIFTQDTSKSFADKHFTENYLKSIRNFSKENNLTLIERKAENGVLTQTTYTPSIYFVNELNFSLYKGRYTETNRLFNFIRSSYSIPRKESLLKMKDAFITQKEKASYIYPIKVSEISGEPQENEQELADHLNTLIRQNTADLTYQPAAKLDYASRKYYLDFHPYVSGKNIYLSAYVFSEFNCKKPIFTILNPVKGKLKKIASVVEETKKQLLIGLHKQIEKGTKGDAHTPISINNKIISLEDLEITRTTSLNNEELSFPTTIPDLWVFDSPVNENTPILQFQIPNTIYTGEVKQLEVDLNINMMTGSAKALLRTLTLGDYGLDASVIERILIEQYPESSIEFKEILKGKEHTINEFIDYEYLIKCNFTFVGKTIEEEIVLTLTPFIKNSELYLQCQSTYDIQLKRQFGIDSGVGESYEEDTIEFYINFILKNK